MEYVRSAFLHAAGSSQYSLSFDIARLNADGDEIESDDDESAHTRRLRMRLAYPTQPERTGEMFRAAAMSTSTSGTIEDILWRTSGSFGSDSEPDALSPEATGNSDHGYGAFGIAPSPRPRYTSSYPNPNPLPAPIEEMLVYPTPKLHQEGHTQSPRIVSVSKYASLAGR